VSTSADRLSAARALLRVADGAYSSRLLARVGSAGVRVRLLGVLRWQRALDEVLATLVRQPLDRLDDEVLVVLRLGLFEISQLEVPPPVATDGAVRLVGKLGKTSAGGLVNAVLRRCSGAWHRRLPSLPLDVRLSHPSWLAERWAQHFGATACERIMRVNQTPATPWAWFFDNHLPQRLASQSLAPHPWCPGAYAARGDERQLISLVTDERAYIQDPASQLVAHVALSLSRPNQTLVDLCSAPGGKLGLLLTRGHWRQAVAVEYRASRLGLVSSLLRRIGHSCPLLLADAKQPPLAQHSWDLVLLDAPCSGTGTLRRHPEIKWRLGPQDITSAAASQVELVKAGLALLAPDGVLLYSTCSIEPEENEGVLSELPDGYEPCDLMAALPPGVGGLPTSLGGVRLLPGDEHDGFTVHGLRVCGRV